MDPYGRPSGYSYDDYAHARPEAPPAHSGPNYRWWIPADGIRRDVIQADIQRYLGNDAVVRPGEGRDENAGRNGYWIAAYRTFTPEMIRDLKADSANFERSGDRGQYQDSMIHRSRQHWGPTQAPPDRGNDSSRASNSTSYTQGTSESYQSNPPGYAPRFPQQPSGYPSGSAEPRSENYTFQQPPPSGGNSRQNYPYETQESSYGSNPRPQPHDTIPRAHQHAYSHTQNNAAQGYTQQNSSSQGYAHQSTAPQGYASTRTSTHPSASSTSREGYYLASDGNYYPNATRPTT